MQNGIVRMPLIMSSFLQRKTWRWASVFHLKSSVWSLSPYFLVGPVQKTNNSKKSPYFLSPDFFSLSSYSLSLWYFPLPQFCKAGTAGDFTPNWLSWGPLSEPFSSSTSGRRDLGSEWRFVYCFSKRGPSLSRSHLSQVPLRPRSTMPDCFCQVARFQARSEQRFLAKYRPWFSFFFHTQRDSKLLSTFQKETQIAVHHQHFICRVHLRAKGCKNFHRQQRKERTINQKGKIAGHTFIVIIKDSR